MKRINNSFFVAEKENQIILADFIFNDKIIDIIPKKEFNFNTPDEFIRIITKLRKDKIKEGSKSNFDGNYNLLIPAGIDPHVHFNEPGFEYRENFYTGTLAAAFGGITTIADMPCTSIPPIMNKKSLQFKLKRIKKKAVVDFAFWGGVSGNSFYQKENIENNINELAKAGVIGLKTYLISVMAKFTELNYKQLLYVGKIAKKLNLPVAVHAEDKKLIERKRKSFKDKGLNTIANYCKTRDDKAELAGINTVIKAAKETGAKFHIVHISSKKGLNAVEKAQKQNIHLTAETCPHFLAFTINDFIKKGNVLKTSPAVKNNGDKEYLWQGIKNNSISFITSDHAGCIFENEKKSDNIWEVYAGIPGTELMLPYIFTEGYVNNRISLKKTIEILSTNAAKYYGLFPQKGSLKLNTDADFCLIDITKKKIISSRNLHCKGKYTPFEGDKFSAVIDKTICRGKVIVDKDKFLGEMGYGEYCRVN